MQTVDDVYEKPRFSDNEEQRLSFKCDKRATISEMLTKIRRQRQLIPIPELNLYRVTFNKKDKMYNFNLITPGQYNTTDVFTKKALTGTFFICSNIDPT